MSVPERRAMVERPSENLSVRRQCVLLNLARSGVYREERQDLSVLLGSPAIAYWLATYCADFKCSHSVIVSSELWPDHVRLSDLEPKFTCKACGQRGADVRQLFEKSGMGTS